MEEGGPVCKDQSSGSLNRKIQEKNLKGKIVWVFLFVGLRRHSTLPLSFFDLENPNQWPWTQEFVPDRCSPKAGFFFY